MDERDPLFRDMLQEFLMRFGEFGKPFLHEDLFELFHIDVSVDIGEELGRRQLVEILA